MASFLTNNSRKIRRVELVYRPATEKVEWIGCDNEVCVDRGLRYYVRELSPIDGQNVKQSIRILWQELKSEHTEKWCVKCLSMRITILVKCSPFQYILGELTRRSEIKILRE